MSGKNSVSLLSIIGLMLLGLLSLGIGAIYLIGWLSAWTRPVTLKSPVDSAPLASTPAAVSLWIPTEIEVITGDRLKATINNQTVLIKLACIEMRPEAQAQKRAADRVRALITLGEPKFYVEWLGTTPDGDQLADFWVSQYGSEPQLVQFILAGAGIAVFRPESETTCPSAAFIQAAQRYGEGRLKSPPTIQLPAF